MVRYSFDHGGGLKNVSSQKIAKKSVYLPKETLLQQWEEMGKTKFGLSRTQQLIILGVTAFFLLITITIVVGRMQVHLEPVHSGDATAKKLKKQEKTTTISLGLDDAGELQTETIVETTGYDKEGHFCATKETKMGTLADAQSSGIITRLDKQMGGSLRDVITKMTGSKTMADRLHLAEKAHNDAVRNGQGEYSTNVGGMHVEIERV